MPDQLAAIVRANKQRGHRRPGAPQGERRQHTLVQQAEEPHGEQRNRERVLNHRRAGASRKKRQSQTASRRLRQTL